MAGRILFMHYYGAYELLIASEIELPELVGIEPSASPDVTVCLGEVPETLSEHAKGSGVFQAEDDRFLLKTQGEERFLVSGGRSIVVHPVPDGSTKSLRLCLLGSCLGALLHQRGVLALHANTVEVEGVALAFVGQSGAGKSTLAAALVQRSHCLLADDVTAVVSSEAGLEVLPAFPRAKLWADSAEFLGYNLAELCTVSETRPKYEIPLRGRFCSARRPLGAIVEVTTSKGAPSLVPVEGVERMSLVLRNTYRKRFLGALGARGPNFEVASRVARGTALLRLTRTTDFDDLPRLVDLVLAAVASLENP